MKANNLIGPKGPGMTQEEAQEYLDKLEKSQGADLTGMESKTFQKLLTVSVEGKNLDDQLISVRRNIEALTQEAARLERSIHMTNGKRASIIELLLDAETQRRIEAAAAEKPAVEVAPLDAGAPN